MATDELLDVYGQDGNATGETIMRFEAHEKGIWHKVIHIVGYTKDGRIILQLRAPEKQTNPNKWDSMVGGHITAGDTPIEAAIRETQEEIGISITGKQLHYLYTRKTDSEFPSANGRPAVINREHKAIYALRVNISLDGLVLQEEEVADIKAFAPEELLAEVRANPDDFAQDITYWEGMVAHIKKVQKSHVSL